MVGEYEITLRNKVVGTMAVSSAGLYYHFRGKCTLSKNCIFRITMSCGDKQENLGVLIPCNGLFLLDTKRPMKQFSDAMPVFTVQSDRESGFPVNENTPFPKLEALDNGVFQKKDGISLILLTDSGPVPQGSDQNP